jgi:hypothetical protein
MIALTGRDKLVELQTPRGNGFIWFEHGDIVHAEYGEFRGELAFYKLLAVGRGSFREMISRPPPRVTVTRSSTHLLMEAARQSDEGVLGEVAPVPAASKLDSRAPTVHEEGGDEASFADLNEPVLEEIEDVEAANSRPIPDVEAPASRIKPPTIAAGERSDTLHLKPLGDEFDEDFAAIDAIVEEDEDEIVEPSMDFELKEPVVEPVRRRRKPPSRARPPESGLEADPPTAPSMLPAETSGAMPVASIDRGAARSRESAAPTSIDGGESSTAMSVAGHAVFDDPDTRAGMLEQFWQFEGVNGVAIISSTGKVLAEDMRKNSSLVTLAGFYMRGAARIARTLGHNVFDGVVARSVNGQQMVMVSMGAASAVLSVRPGADPEAVRDQVMGVE